MRKLLRANGSRLLRDRAFWLLAALMAALGASMAVVNAVHARQDGEIWTMDYTLFIYVILAPILASGFCLPASIFPPRWKSRNIWQPIPTPKTA